MKDDSRTKEALRLIQECKPSSPSDFAKMFWPDSLMHGRRSKSGRGVQPGKAAWLSAGSFIGKMRRKGLVFINSPETRYKYGWVSLTQKGQDLLKGRE